MNKKHYMKKIQKNLKNAIIIILSILVLVFIALFIATSKEKSTVLINYRHAKNSVDKLTKQIQKLHKESNFDEEELAFFKSQNKYKNYEKIKKGGKGEISFELEKIEKDVQACLDKGTAMLGCNYNAIDKYNIVIEKNIEKFKKILTQSQYNDILNSQRQWKKFIEADNKMLNNSLGNLDGTIHPLLASEYKVQNYITRANELSSLYNLYLYIISF